MLSIVRGALATVLSDDTWESDVPTDPTQALVEGALRRWQTELLDLTRANRLLHLGARRSGVVRLHHPDSPTLLKLLQSSKRKLKFYQPAAMVAPTFFDDDEDEPPTTWTPPRTPARDELIPDLDPKRLEGSLNRLRLRSNALMREQGVQTLYVAFGTATWRATTRDEEYVSPLLLVPVRLERTRAVDPHTLSGIGQDAVVNPALVRRLAMTTGREVPEFDGEPTSDLQMIARQLTDLARPLVSWQVETESATLGMFSFAKYAMYVDLERNHSRLREHPLIQAVAGAGGESLIQPAIFPGASELDNTMSARSTWQILDADSSQQETIAWVGAGASLVVQGPPGTGKSQTIANIIGEAMGQGRTVLFVSEKLAALRIVSNRLETSGLKPFLLEAHGSDDDRREIYRDLFRTWQEPPRPGAVRLSSLDSLDAARSRLAAYAQSLHDSDSPLGFSAFQAVSELSRLVNTPTVRFALERPEALTEARRAEIREAIHRLMLVDLVVKEQDSHPWRGLRLVEHSGVGGLADGQLLDDLLMMVRHAHELVTHAPGIGASYGIEVELTVEELQRLAELIGLIARSKQLPMGWQEQTQRQAMRRFGRASQDLETGYQAKRASLLSQVDVQLLDEDLEALRQGLCLAPRAGEHLVADGTPAIVAVDNARPELQSLLSQSIGAIAHLRTCAAMVAKHLGLETPQTPMQIADLNEIASVIVTGLQAPRSWMEPLGKGKIIDLIGEAEHRSNEIRRGRDRLDSFFAGDYLPVLTESSLRQQLDTTHPSALKRLSPAYRRALHHVKQIARQVDTITPQLASGLVAEAHALQQNQHWFRINHAALIGAIGRFYQAEATDWQEVRSTLTTVEHLLGRLPIPIPRGISSLLTESVPAEVVSAIAALEQCLIRVNALVSQLRERTTLEEQLDSSWSSASLDAIEANLVRMHSELEEVWSALDTVRAKSVSGSLEADHVEALVREATAVLDLRTRWTIAQQQLTVQFGSFFDPEQPNWEAMSAELDLADQIASWYQGSPPPDVVSALDQLREQAQTDFGIVAHAVSELSTRLQRIEPQFHRSALPGQSLSRTNLAQVIEWAQFLTEQGDLLGQWQAFLLAKRRSDEAGIGGAVAALSRSALPTVYWPDAVERRVLEAWLDWWRGQKPLLAETELALLPNRVASFRQLDTAQWEVASRRIQERIIAGFPDRAAPKVRKGQKTAAGLLAHEAGKRQRHLPLRRFFAEHAEFVASIKPCWLMSPLAVAQHLGDSDLQFDLVIFDEASQILPADAIGAISRGRQVVVVGDPEQLPPTRFFATGATSLDGDETGDVPESILDACREVLPMQTLNWHYRSRHEQLIAFSNAHFYDQRLLSLPSTEAGRHPISVVHIADGVYDAGKSRTNRVEAARVAEGVIAYRRKYPHRSLGVVTFSEAQMLAVQYEIDVRKRADIGLEGLLNESGGEGFFIKNLENVQGDERDTIFFSVGYGPDKSGHLSHNFGPLNRAGGERRLNVAITRAREEIVIYTSFTSDQIDQRRTSSRGLRLLRAYLEYAERGERNLKAESDVPRPDALISSVVETLREQGLTVETGLGASAAPIDIVVKSPHHDRYVLAIEGDGITYRQLPTVRDRERLRAERLESLGWRVYQLRSLQWLEKQSEELDAILRLASPASM